MPHSFYNHHANKLAQRYISTSLEYIHQGWFSMFSFVLSKPNTRILDIGAGRVNKYFFQQGTKNNIHVTTVEHAQALTDMYGLFQAMELQRARLKEMQQLREW